MSDANTRQPAPGNASRGQTSQSLKNDIDQGRTRDKVAYPDPATSPLGTDDEAGGHPPTAEQIEMARKQEVTSGEGVVGRDYDRSGRTRVMLLTAIAVALTLIICLLLVVN